MRIEAVNPAVNAISRLMAESAREATRDLDQQRATGASFGPLAGVPVTVKENIHVAGMTTTHGVPGSPRLTPRRCAGCARRGPS